MWDTLYVIVFVSLFFIVARDAWQDCFRGLAAADATAWCCDRFRRIPVQARLPLAGLTGYIGLLVGYGLGWAPAYYGFIAVTAAGGVAIVGIFVADVFQQVASHFEWRDMGYPTVREQTWWTIGFILAGTAVLVATNAPRDAFYAEVPGDLAVAGRIFGGLFALMALLAFTTPLRLRPPRARI
ncbi:MAG: hypothetical protein Q8R32_03765 [bacterium]|nr:hypothetical protein [bacterium]